MNNIFEFAGNNTLNYKSKCYIASKTGVEEDDYGNQIETYDTPKSYLFNIQPVTDASEIAAFGELATGMRKALVSKKIYFNKFKKFDRAYLEGATPQGEVNNGDNANYRIYAILPQNVAEIIYFTKIVKGDE